ncbi:MAG TPA: hypothetical protein VD993_04960 [Chitinophagaceae bacterium]|nr:hypothetical protein [Chitinophagaceae bacterium]
MNLLNLIWPAIYVAMGLRNLWYCILITIVLEWIIVQLLLRKGWRTSGFMSLVGNAVSGFFGIFIMPYVMFLYHSVADPLTGGTFNIINLVATLVIMCFGSVAIEVLVVKWIWKTPFKKLFIPLLIGNLLTYVALVFFFMHLQVGGV